jgi:hypothetical protein
LKANSNCFPQTYASFELSWKTPNSGHRSATHAHVGHPAKVLAKELSAAKQSTGARRQPPIPRSCFMRFQDNRVFTACSPGLAAVPSKLVFAASSASNIYKNICTF